METPAVVRILGQLAVRSGRALDSAGLAFQDKLGAVDRRTYHKRFHVAGAARKRVPAALSVVSLNPSSLCPFFAVVPSTRVVAVKGKSLEHGVDHFVASSASLIGDVHMGERSAAWYGATVRGELRI
jgi:hypothetical protein